VQQSRADGYIRRVDRRFSRIGLPLPIFFVRSQGKFAVQLCKVRCTLIFVARQKLILNHRDNYNPIEEILQLPVYKNLSVSRKLCKARFLRIADLGADRSE
jgi:hypothetical protein